MRSYLQAILGALRLLGLFGLAWMGLILAGLLIWRAILAASAIWF